MLLKVKAIVMDMDGTITKFNLDYMGARRRALEELDEMNLRTTDMTEQISLYVVLKKLKDSIDADKFSAVKAKFYNLLEEMELKAAREVILYPGVLDTLRKLRGRTIKIGIVTNNGRAGTALTLKRYNLEGFFDSIVTRDDCEQMKPDAGPVLQSLTEMHASREEAILVGDGIMDVIAAKEAGLPSVAVPTGPFSHERLLQAEPDYLIASINDLPALIESLENSRHS
jgi:HAD superfamily hydrolase (TIGR01509 family)